MEITLKLFGQLCDLAGSESVVLKDVSDTRTLQDALQKKYPALAAAKYIIAVDRKQVHENTPLHENSSIALLPPFSGG